LATWTYQLGFGSVRPDFGPAAAMGNLLSVLAVVFGFIYIRVQSRQENQ
jgi:multiple sugar transport system permease protein